MTNDEMELWDRFAAMAMQAIITKHGGYEDDKSHPKAIRSFSENAPTVDEVAGYAYAQADAMMVARAQAIKAAADE